MTDVRAELVDRIAEEVASGMGSIEPTVQFENPPTGVGTSQPQAGRFIPDRLHHPLR